jgi:selenocysteine lyase/cysteine desulfurase
LLEQGVGHIEEHNQRLVSRLVDGLDLEKYNLLSPRERDARSTLVFISHKQPSRNGKIYNALRQSGVHIAFRAGKLRFSPHLYNTDEEIDYALSVLESAGS